MNLPKKIGRVFQETKAKFEDIRLKSFYRQGSDFEALVSFKNIGQSLWGDNNTKVSPKISGAEKISNLKLEKMTTNNKTNVNESDVWKISGTLPEKGVVTLGFAPIDQNQNQLTKSVNMPIYVAGDWEYIYLSARDILSGIL